MQRENDKGGSTGSVVGGQGSNVPPAPMGKKTPQQSTKVLTSTKPTSSSTVSRLSPAVASLSAVLTAVVTSNNKMTIWLSTVITPLVVLSLRGREIAS